MRLTSETVEKRDAPDDQDRTHTTGRKVPSNLKTRCAQVSPGIYGKCFRTNITLRKVDFERIERMGIRQHPGGLSGFFRRVLERAESGDIEVIS